MKSVWLAAGLAAGYVLGTKAGRERYEQIAAKAKEVASSPTVTDMQAKAKELAERGRDKVTAKLHSSDDDTTKHLDPVSTM